MANRWRQENYFKYAREHFALDALDSYADQGDDPDRLVPNPAKAHAHDHVSADLRAGGADMVVGVGLGRVGDQPVGVVALVGVAVQGVQGEVLTGAGEVVLLPPPVGHPVGDLRCGQVGAVGQDRGLVPAGAGPHDQPQRQRARRSCAGGRGGGSGRDRQVDQTFGELVADGRPVGGGEVVERERGRSGPGPGALVVGEQVEPGCDDLGEHRRGVPAPVEYHGAGPVGADDGAQVGQQTGQLGGQNVSAATSRSPVISNAGSPRSSPASGRWAPSVTTTGASARFPNRAATRSAVRGAGAASTTSSPARATSRLSSWSTVSTTPSCTRPTGRVGSCPRGATRPRATRTVAVDTSAAAAI